MRPLASRAGGAYGQGHAVCHRQAAGYDQEVWLRRREEAGSVRRAVGQHEQAYASAPERTGGFHPPIRLLRTGGAAPRACA